jgi:predicted small metal-binding protein
VKEFEKVNNGRKPKTMDEVLINLFPNRNWEHLERGGRIRSASAKAIENERQRNGYALAKKSKRSSKPPVSVDDYERNMYLICRNEFRGTGKKKVTKRASKQSPETFDQCQDKWQFEVPTEDDDDEIRLCVQASVRDEALVDSYSGILLDEKFLNWRQIAEANPSELQQRFEFICKERNVSCPSLDAVDEWIVKAQQETMDEIMTEIFTHADEKKGVEVAVEIILLLKKTKTDTPFDFVGVWAHLPPDQMLELLKCDPTRHTVNDARRWVSRAKRAIERHPWLKDFLNRID